MSSFRFKPKYRLKHGSSLLDAIDVEIGFSSLLTVMAPPERLATSIETMLGYTQRR